MLWVYGYYKYFSLSVCGSTLDVRIWRHWLIDWIRLRALRVKETLLWKRGWYLRRGCGGWGLLLYYVLSALLQYPWSRVPIRSTSSLWHLVWPRDQPVNTSPWQISQWPRNKAPHRVVACTDTTQIPVLKSGAQAVHHRIQMSGSHYHQVDGIFSLTRLKVRKHYDALKQLILFYYVTRIPFWTWIS